MSKTKFAKWLSDVLEIRHMSKADLARATGLSPAQITRITKGDQGTGVDTVVAIARALKLPPAEVFKQAADINQRSEKTMTALIIENQLEQITEEDQEEILGILEAKIKIKERKKIRATNITENIE
jgi:transcriptional regulator with XRE-family HTH domain